VIHVNALSAFDDDPVGELPNVVYGAPVLTSERRAVPTELPWEADDPTPLVLLSFSTVNEQRNVTMLQRALDALASLPVHVVATTGQIVDPGELSAPANAWLTPFADHDQLLHSATFVVGHGGHGTTMRALRHGRPIVGIPALALDQVPITQLIEMWGAGRALPPDADVDQIRAAAEDVLKDDRFATEARRRSASFGSSDGAQLAADSIEQSVITSQGSDSG
jgi:UDP:flavonoid glycosyltransferase YjiC (YdhE family)